MKSQPAAMVMKRVPQKRAKHPSTLTRATQSEPPITGTAHSNIWASHLTLLPPKALSCTFDDLILMSLLESAGCKHRSNNLQYSFVCRQILAAAKDGRAQDAADLLECMKEAGLPPGSRAYHGLICAHCKARDTDSALSTVRQAVLQGECCSPSSSAQSLGIQFHAPNRYVRWQAGSVHDLHHK